MEDNHARAAQYTPDELHRFIINQHEQFAQAVFALAGVKYLAPCTCHSYAAGYLVISELRERLAAQKV